MEQHPIPQQISSYHFRLVGDMTIKQFIELAAGIVFAWILYSLPLPGIIRWPFVILSVLTGIALAFLPFEERPLDQWFIAYIKAIYSPTKYIWKKSTKIPNFFEEIKPRKKSDEKREGVDRTKLKEYLEALPSQGPESSIDKKESRFILNIMNMYMEVQPTTASTIKPKQSIIEEERIPKVQIRKLKTPPLNPLAIRRGEIIMPKKAKGKPKQVQIPAIKPIEIEKLFTSSPIPQTQAENTPETSPINLSGIPTTGSQAKPKTKKASTKATLSSDLPIPTPPTQPNVLVGMVLNNNNNIVENAIITIKDSKGNVARALKTNKIGQFFIATPLDNDTYEIEIEKEGLTFDIIKITLKGEPISPIEIKSKAI